MEANYLKRELDLHQLTGTELDSWVANILKHFSQILHHRIGNTFYNTEGIIKAMYYPNTKEVAFDNRSAEYLKMLSGSSSPNTIEIIEYLIRNKYDIDFEKIYFPSKVY